MVSKDARVVSPRPRARAAVSRCAPSIASRYSSRRSVTRNIQVSASVKPTSRTCHTPARASRRDALAACRRGMTRYPRGRRKDTNRPATAQAAIRSGCAQVASQIPEKLCARNSIVTILDRELGRVETIANACCHAGQERRLCRDAGRGRGRGRKGGRWMMGGLRAHDCHGRAAPRAYQGRGMERLGRRHIGHRDLTQRQS